MNTCCPHCKKDLCPRCQSTNTVVVGTTKYGWLVACRDCDAELEADTVPTELVERA